MKDEKTNPDVYTPSENWQGFAVPFTATAYVMANSLEDARFKVEAAMRKQQRVMLTKLDMLQPVQSDAPEAIENIPSETVTVQRIANRELVPDTVTIEAPPYVVCSAHKRDVHKKCACTPGETCNAAYWSAKLKGGK